MARGRYIPSDSHFQVGSRLIRALLATLLISSLTLSASFAETSEPTPVTADTTTVTATPKPTPKATPKPTVKKKTKARVSPSPKVIWPPKGFKASDDVYAKIPTSKELIGIISADKYLTKRIKECENFICGAVQVASAGGCTWWEVRSTVFDGKGVKLGDLVSAHGASKVREIKTFITISPEPANLGGKAKIVTVLCHHDVRDTANPSVTYTKVN